MFKGNERELVLFGKTMIFVHGKTVPVTPVKIYFTSRRLRVLADRQSKKYLVILCCMRCYFTKICDDDIYDCLKSLKDTLDCVK